MDRKPENALFEPFSLCRVPLALVEESCPNLPFSRILMDTNTQPIMSINRVSTIAKSNKNKFALGRGHHHHFEFQPASKEERRKFRERLVYERRRDGLWLVLSIIASFLMSVAVYYLLTSPTGLP